MRRIDTSSVRCNAAFRFSRDSFILNHFKFLAMQPKFTQRSFMLHLKTIATTLIFLSSVCFSYAQKQNKLQQKPETMSVTQWQQLNGKQIVGINPNSQVNNDAGKVFPSSGINPIQSPQ